MPFDVQYLIEAGERISYLFRPSLELFPIESRVDFIFAELGFLSSRRAYWEPFVCVMGFARKQQRNPHQLLLEIPFKNFMYYRWSSSDAFRIYCEQFPLMPQPEFLAGGYALQLVFDAARPFHITLATLDDFERCEREHDGNIQELTRCLEQSR
ncbi:MAG TPA: hypothetical protein VFD70_03835 [Anaerolineae bacterium]|nr:hypothetical protein [Anaerolineae bacterium]